MGVVGGMSLPGSAVVPAAPTELVASTSATLPVGTDGFPTAGSIKEVASSFGFEGVDFDVYGAVPNIVLDKGEFLIGRQVMADQMPLVRLGTSRKKYLLSFGPEGHKELFYTYDLKTDANDPSRTVEAFYRDAAQAGQSVVQSTYYEVSCTLLATQEPVNLSIPAAGSGTAFAGLLTKLFARRIRPQDAVIRLKKGARVEGKRSGQSFIPWEFEIVEP